MNRKGKLLFLFLICSILSSTLFIIPSTAEEDEEKKEEKPEEPIKEEKAPDPAPPPPSEEKKAATTKKPEKKPKPKGRHCFVCAHCSTPENEMNCANHRMQYCVKTEWEATGEITRYCGKKSERKFITEHGRECDNFVDGVKVCYCDEDLCNASFSPLPKTLVLTLFSFGTGLHLFLFLNNC